MIITDKLKYLSLFSGIGGFELGIEQSNIPMECIGYAEIDKYARSIYERQYPNHFNWGDVTQIRTDELPDFDFLVGGFPCQAFSHAGLRRGFDDTRGTLFFEIARILKDKRPTYFLLENVRGLLHNNNGETFQTILKVLSDLGYNVKWEIFNSKEFVPQKRERIFIKGCIRERCGGEILSFRRADSEVSDKLNDQKIMCEKKSLKIHNNTKKGYKEAFPYDGVIISRFGKRTSRGMVQSNCVGTIDTCPSWGTVMENYKIRKLTPVECERLQGFPDNYTKYGKDNELISNSQRYKCIGNAVTVPVITFIINEMFGDLIEE